MTAARDPSFYLAHAGYVRALARRLVYDPHAADDLFQAAWLAALERAPADGSAPRRWLAALVRNLAIKTWLGDSRRRAREQRTEPPGPASSPADVLVHESERQRVVAALLAVDEPYRTALIQRFFDGLEPQQIAARTGVPVETVRTRQKRGLQKLRERLSRDGALSVAFVHGLRLGPPGPGAVATRIGRGLLLMSSAKKLVVVGVMALVAAFALRPGLTPAGPVTAKETVPAAPLATADAGAAPAPATPERMTVPAPNPANTPAGSPTGALAAHVTWLDHTPAAGIGARVGQLDAPNFEVSVVTARTNAAGDFLLDALSPGEWLVQLDRGTVGSTIVRAGSRSELELRLEGGAAVKGHVRDFDGRPAAGAEIYFVCNPAEHAGHVVAQAAADGSFAIRDVPAQVTCGVSARAKDRAPTRQQLISAKAGATIDLELVFTARGGAVAGRITGADGQPVAGAAILVGYEGSFAEAARSGVGESAPVRCRRAASDAHGDYRVDGLAPGDAPITVVAAGSAPWLGSLRVSEVAVTRCDVTLQPGARLRGIVRDEHGAVVVGAGVTVGRFGITSMSTLTAGDGSYALDGLPVDDFEALARQPGAGEARSRQQGQSGVVNEWNPVLRRETTLHGRIVAPGRPLGGFRISARGMPSARANWFRDDTSGEDGRFEFTNCPPALLHLEAHPPASGQFVVAVQEDVDPFAGEVVLTVDPAREPTARVRGRIVDERGEPIADAELAVLPSNIDWGGGHSVQAGNDGRFQSPACPPGEWRLVVTATGFARCTTAARTLAADAILDWGDVVLTRGGSIAVTVTPEDDLDPTEVRVSLQDRWSGLALEPLVGGAATFRGIAAGSYRIIAYGREVALRVTPVEVRDRAQTDVALRLSRGSEVMIEVRDARGQPVDDRIETELFDGSGSSVDTGPLIPTNNPPAWIRRLVAGRYELRLRDHLGRSCVLPFAVTAAPAPLRLTATLR